MHIGRGNRNLDYVMGGSKLQVEDSEKDLGIIITDDGEFKAVFICI